METVCVAKHPNIVKYLGHKIIPEKEINIFFEFYMESLHSLISKHRESCHFFTPQEILTFSLQIANGLLYLHTLPNPVIHRDLKVSIFYLIIFCE